MNIEIPNIDLEQLILSGRSVNYKNLSKDKTFVDWLAQAMNIISVVGDISDLLMYKSLNYHQHGIYFTLEIKTRKNYVVLILRETEQRTIIVEQLINKKEVIDVSQSKDKIPVLLQ